MIYDYSRGFKTLNIELQDTQSPVLHSYHVQSLTNVISPAQQ